MASFSIIVEMKSRSYKKKTVCSTSWIGCDQVSWRALIQFKVRLVTDKEQRICWKLDAWSLQPANDTRVACVAALDVWVKNCSLVPERSKQIFPPQPWLRTKLPAAHRVKVVSMGGERRARTKTKIGLISWRALFIWNGAIASTFDFTPGWPGLRVGIGIGVESPTLVYTRLIIREDAYTNWNRAGDKSICSTERSRNDSRMDEVFSFDFIS